MSPLLIRRACTGSVVCTGRWAGPIGGWRTYRFAAVMPLWTSSIPASDPCSCTLSTSRACIGMSASSHSRPSMYPATSVEWCSSTSSVQTTAQPPSAFTPRISAWALG